MIFVTNEKGNRLAAKNEEKLLKGTLFCNLIWGRVVDCAGKGFGFLGDIFTPAQ